MFHFLVAGFYTQFVIVGFGARKFWPRSGSNWKVGAVEWIRTTTVLLPPAPQAGASASSATTAFVTHRKRRGFRLSNAGCARRELFGVWFLALEQPILRDHTLHGVPQFSERTPPVSQLRFRRLNSESPCVSQGIENDLPKLR
jgi:hypothetical protein